MAVNNKFFVGPFSIDPAYVNNAINAFLMWQKQVGSLNPTAQSVLNNLQLVDTSVNPTTIDISLVRQAVDELNAWLFQGGIDNASLQTLNELKYLVDNYVMTILIGGRGKDAYVLYQQH